MLKENQPEVKEAVEVWIEAERERQGRCPFPDDVVWNQGHGRIECREVWWVRAEELGAYLEREYDWPGVTVCGRIRRRRWRKDGSLEGEEVEVWVSSAPVEKATPQQVQEWLRGHWTIENRVFRVRDVSYQEDRLHGRKIGLGLAALRNGGVNIIRRLGYQYIPDAWRDFSRCPERLPWLLSRLC